ncbi:hypothetical protein N7478_004368 [Penicillium angulare]|uniref:uncharacterized protein n=1 Tax=Penicillium angulare TaxID=116970 RepID=UPI0025422B9E|nr:uncharacterized protein N7478_004368 [Penicillium angulare]KAJ5278996.1 hypothetical protein N7478_004368 [Penicillium angulare]
MGSEHMGVYCTLLLSDNYLPGAMVLAHSLRDNGTSSKLVALFTPDTLRSETVNELRTVYDELIPVDPFVNGTPANLWLMDRPDLIATFTKIELWRLTQYERIVYIDCDVVALRAPDELFSLDVNFAAAPDVGWPDCFNSGLMVLRPNMQDYYSLKALAERGISFDGADQGLLNMHFRDWHRLSFTYNCTPSANYQYIPAYKHFQSTISLIHFIGSQKPWNLPRQVVPMESPYNQLLNKWWSVYDRHYRLPFVSFSQSEGTQQLTRTPGPHVHLVDQLEATSANNQIPEILFSHYDENESVSYRHEEFASNEGVPALVSSETVHVQSQPDTWQPPSEHNEQSHHDHNAPQDKPYTTEVPVMSAVPQYVRGEEHVSTFIPPGPYAPPPATYVHHPTHGTQPEIQHHQPQQHHHHHEHHKEQHQQHQAPDHVEPHIYQPQPVAPPPAVEHWQRPPSPEPEIPTFEAPQAEWDASREPPPLNTKPEGGSLEEKMYTMSEDTNLFQPPQSYPEPPKNMYYQLPETKPEPQKATSVFPWENHAPAPTRVFAQELPVPRIDSPEQPAPQKVELQQSPKTPPPRALFEPIAESWEHYSRSNAWDDDPQIQRYMESMQQARHGKPQVISGSAHESSSHSANTSISTSNFSFSSISTTTGPSSGHRPSLKLTDFPTELERPSLPVTPAPIHRNRALGEDYDTSDTVLPTAEGVPNQEDWVGVTVDAFSQLLRATYLLWRSTESPGAARRAPPSTIRGFGGSGALI